LCPLIGQHDEVEQHSSALWEAPAAIARASSQIAGSAAAATPAMTKKALIPSRSYSSPDEKVSAAEHDPMATA
jgi:hypothetical protein